MSTVAVRSVRSAPPQPLSLESTLKRLLLLDPDKHAAFKLLAEDALQTALRRLNHYKKARHINGGEVSRAGLSSV